MFDPAYANNYNKNDIEGIFSKKFKQYTLTSKDEEKLIPLFKRAQDNGCPLIGEAPWSNFKCLM